MMRPALLVLGLMVLAGTAAAQGDFKVTPAQVMPAPATTTTTTKPTRTTPAKGATTVCPSNKPNCKN